MVLPAADSAKLSTRSMVTVDGILEGQTFQARLEPDGAGRHWLKVDKALRGKAGVASGDTMALQVAPTARAT